MNERGQRAENPPVDVIGIGAINFDFIYSSRKSDWRDSKTFDDGEEIFVRQHEGYAKLLLKK
ncbi:MAG: hypothetical protein FWD74_11935 [Actinomycetia bacterium]|nr:hypothetical protein [Actinomycetes bacterium]